jgi:hypothetical protein
VLDLMSERLLAAGVELIPLAEADLPAWLIYPTA